MAKSLEEKLKILESEVEVKPLKESSLEKLFFKHYPIFSFLSQAIEKSGLSISKLVAFYQSASHAAQAARGLQITGAILSGLDWLVLPIAYLAYRWAGEPFPYSFSTGLKWSYSLAVFTLAVVALAVPAIALPIAIASGSLVLGLSITRMAKQLWAISQSGKKKIERQNLSDDISALKSQLKDIQTEARELNEKQKDNPEVKEQVDQWMEQREEWAAKLQKKSDRLAVLENEAKLVSKGNTVNKVAGLALSSLALASLVTALFVPPVGLTMLVTTSALGLGYIGFGLLSKSIMAIVESRKKPQASKNNKESVNVETFGEGLHEEKRHDSTIKISELLFHDSKDFLKALIGDQHDMEQRIDTIKQRLNYIYSKQDHAAALVFMQKVSEHLVDNYPPRELKNFFHELPGFDKVVPIFREAMNKVLSGELPLGENDLASICKIKPVKDYVEYYQISQASEKENLVPAQDPLQELIFSGPTPPSQEHH